MQAFKVAERNAQDSMNRAIGMAKGANLALKADVVEEIHPKQKKTTSKGTTQVVSSPRSRSCFNCDDKFHFIAECPFDNRETHGGRLIPKNKAKETKAPYKKPFNKNKKNFTNKKPSRIVLLTQEEYSSEDDDNEEDEEETTNGVTAIATTSTSSSSLFESPNENPHIKNAHCFMARSTEVSTSIPSMPKSQNTQGVDHASLKVKQEMLDFNDFIFNLQGESKKHVGSLLSRLGQLEEILEVKYRIEREDSLEVSSLKNALEEEQETVASLEEKLEALEEPQDEIFAKLTKERDHAKAKLKDELAKSSLPQSEKSLDDLLSKQRSNNGKDGLGYVAKAKKKNKKKAKPAQEKKKVVNGGDASKGKATIDDHAGIANPHYVLLKDYYGDVYAKYVGPYDGYIACDEGIRHQYSVAYTPQQNGVAERKNRTLMDMARSMLAEFKSPFNFWAEAISTACHSSNRLYLRKGLNKTPYEILSGHKPNIYYFKVFGCKCFYKIKGVRLSKFESKALEGIFVGYGAESHTYRIYDKASEIVVDSCSVVFDENDGSQVGQVDVCADDEIPQDAIARMVVGFFRPVEGHVMVNREGLCSTQVEPSSSQHQQAPNLEANDAPTQEQAQDPLSNEQDQGQYQSRNDDGGSPSDVQDQPHDGDQTQEIEQAQVDGQDGDPNDQVDQVIPLRTSRSKEEIEARRIARRDRNLEILGHTHDKVLSDVRGRVSTRRQLANFSNHHAYISLVEPKKVLEALEDLDWLDAMHEELNNFKRNKVWKLVEKPKECRNVIGTKWIFKNKQDENGIVVRNKARLVAQGFSQIEGIDFGETYAPMAHLESIRILLAYATHHNFKLQQIDVKSAFLNGPLREEVYVKQPPGFEDPNFPNHVYKLDKALYGLKQAPRAWFEMSMMGEMRFFLGFEINQLREGTFINQEKYIQDMLKRFKMKELKGVATPMQTKSHLELDPNGKEVDQKVSSFS
ncbi:hypothetical protein ACQ4PT_016441 [Festuca glaucescens]